MKYTQAVLTLKNLFCGIILASAILFVTACTMTDITSSTTSAVDTVTPDVSLNHFVDVRISSIKKESAAGEGENLNALANLMGKQDKAAFADWMQTNYDELFSNLEQPSELITRIETLSSQS